MNCGRSPYEAVGMVIAALLVAIVVATLVGILALALDFMAGALGSIL